MLPFGCPGLVEATPRMAASSDNYALAVILVQEIVRGVVGDVDVQIGVRIEIRQDDSQPLPFGHQTGFPRNIAERAVAVARYRKSSSGSKRRGGQTSRTFGRSSATGSFSQDQFT